MSLASLLSADQIIPEMRATDRWPAIVELIDLLVSLGKIKPEDSGGIEFDALDNAPVKFIVLFIVPKNQFQTHLRTLASIAKFLNDRSVRESLAEAKSADTILSVFRDRS